eukprot:TRINITY_DN5022_c0_g2_i3.p1 TRINITY_DN5022_c0_g2~~TRINITY_DN5022_c0_g2_i3.p1  ORF type:complete len:435 (+),score=23.88 TRINITY_DN5022_c0_g2_i3:179-1483(+)
MQQDQAQGGLEETLSGPRWGWAQHPLEELRRQEERKGNKEPERRDNDEEDRERRSPLYQVMRWQKCIYNEPPVHEEGERDIEYFIILKQRDVSAKSNHFNKSIVWTKTQRRCKSRMQQYASQFLSASVLVPIAIRMEIENINQTSNREFARNWVSYMKLFNTSIDNRECWTTWHDICYSEWRGLIAITNQVNKTKDQARLDAILPILKEMLAHGLHICMVNVELNRTYENFNVSGFSRPCWNLVERQESMLRKYSLNTYFLRNDSVNNELVNSSRGECFIQSPECSEVFQLSQTIYSFVSVNPPKWFFNLYTRAYGYFIRECSINSTRRKKEDKCQSFIEQVQTKINAAVKSFTDYDTLALQLRATRTLAEEFVQCVDRREDAEFCQTIAKALPTLITRAIFSRNANEMKTRITSIEEASKDIINVCFTSSEQE